MTVVVDNATKLIALSAIGTYVIGFLTVNRYLRNLGASDFSLVRGRYISMGFTAFMYIVGLGLLPVVGVFILYQSIKAMPQLPSNLVVPDIGFIAVIVSAIIIGLILTFIPWDLLTTRAAMGRWQSLKTSLTCFLLIALVCLALITLRYALRPAYTGLQLPPAPKKLSFDFSQLRSSAWPSIEQILDISLSSILFIGFLAAAGASLMVILDQYADKVLPQIPVRFGGAQPTEVRLLIDQKEVDSVKQLKVPVPLEDRSKVNQLTDPIRLLWIGDQSYIIALSDDRVVQVTKAAVKGIMAIPQQPITAITERHAKGNTIFYLIVLLVFIFALIINLLRGLGLISY